MKERLHQLAVDIFHTAKENNIEVEVEWIACSLSKKADYLSKIVDFHRVKKGVSVFRKGCGKSNLNVSGTFPQGGYDVKREREK